MMGGLYLVTIPSKTTQEAGTAKIKVPTNSSTHYAIEREITFLSCTKENEPLSKTREIYQM